jgi:hypothetical protein
MKRYRSQPYFDSSMVFYNISDILQCISLMIHFDSNANIRSFVFLVFSFFSSLNEKKTKLITLGVILRSLSVPDRYNILYSKLGKIHSFLKLCVSYTFSNARINNTDHFYLVNTSYTLCKMCSIVF